MVSHPEERLVIPVILTGGVGSRLWPLSREAHPKPFIKLADGKSLVQKTYLRATAIKGIKEVITITNRELFFYHKDEYEQVSEGNISHSFLLEPFGRNTSAAIGLAASYVEAKYGTDCILLVLPADQLIDNQAKFLAAVQSAVMFAGEGRLVTFGIQPGLPKTAYGYIEAEGNRVKRFVEKPNLELAEQYVTSGNYFWNSGMFCMSVDAILGEMDKLCSDIISATRECLETASYSSGEGYNQVEISAQSFEPIRSISIDYAVFEKTENAAVIPCDVGWSDIGSWVEFGELHSSDSTNNYIHGETVLEDVMNCIVYADNKLVTGLGIKDLIIADTQDALLVVHRDRAQDIGKIVSILKQKNNPSYRLFPTVHRPWGTYTVLQEGQGFQLKRIEVKPHAKLSLQSHQHRSEHWVVVSGTAQVTNGSEVFQLMRNESTYIPAGNKHRLENLGAETLIFIEIQCGDYLGEDDIVRYDDVYNRV